MKKGLILGAIVSLAVLTVPAVAEAKTFPDVSSKEWYYDTVSEISDKGIMKGMGTGEYFAPVKTLTRAELATILYRMAGAPKVEYSAVFPDVKAGDWYASAVLWCNQSKVANGYGNGYFGPLDLVTREQVAKMICSYRAYMGYNVENTAELDAFVDAEKVSGYAIDYVKWAVADGVITGKTDPATGGKALDPGASTTRAEIATMIARTLVPFSGQYVIDVETAMSKIGQENVLFVDSGNDPQKTTIKGAVVTGWQAWSDHVASEVEGSAGYWHVKEEEAFANVLSSLGITPEKEIILLGESKNGWGDDARLMWQLRMAGFEKVSIVDGGYSALVKAGAETQSGSSILPEAAAGSFEYNKTHYKTTADLVAAYDTYKIIDVRADAEYDGGILYGERVGGRLPGAVHLKYTDLFYDDGTLRPNKELTKWFETAGLNKGDQIVSYCTAGIRSSYMQVVMEMCGFENTFNYDESFWGWAETNSTNVEK